MKDIHDLVTILNRQAFGLIEKEKAKKQKAKGLPTGTGRLTESKPNLQNIPIKSELGKEIRKKITGK